LTRYKLRENDSDETKVCKIALNMLENIGARKSDDECDRCGLTRALARCALIDVGEIGVDYD